MANSMPDLSSSPVSWGSPTPGGQQIHGDSSPSMNENTWTPMRPETPHQRLQRGLLERKSGVPREQISSAPQRLRNTRSTEILHSSLEEPLTRYKSLVPSRPRWPSHFRRYHLNEGINVKDQDTILVEAKDQHVKTRKGLVRKSSGFVTYSENHRRKAEIDTKFLAEIVNGGVPGGAHNWTPKKLEVIFRERTGRNGIWRDYEVPIKQYLSLFPKTFQQFGPDMQFVRLKHILRPGLFDSTEDAMSRLACARERGFVEPHPHLEGTVGLHNEELIDIFRAFDEGRPTTSLEELRNGLRASTPTLPELREQRMKVAFLATPVHDPMHHEHNKWLEKQKPKSAPATLTGSLY